MRNPTNYIMNDQASNRVTEFMNARLVSDFHPSHLTQHLMLLAGFVSLTIVLGL